MGGQGIGIWRGKIERLCPRPLLKCADFTVSQNCTGELHPSINLSEPEEEVDMDLIVGASKQKMDVNVALSNSFGFGGHNSSIMFKAFRE